MSIFCESNNIEGLRDLDLVEFSKSLKILNDMGFVVISRSVYDKFLSRLADAGNNTPLTAPELVIAMKDAKW